MTHILKYKLEFELAYSHVKDNLENANYLSTTILNLLDLKKGHFFTLLPDTANLSHLYKFREEGVFFQNLHEKHSEKKQQNFSQISSIIRELSEFMLKAINSRIKPQVNYVFDDYNSDVDKVLKYDLFEYCGHCFNSEVYYVLNNKNNSLDLIYRCLNDSNTLWRSLCVCTAADLTKINKELVGDNFKEICEKTELFMVWAYDSKGYVFWEKGGCAFFE